jgi:hypothetical protein
VTLTHSDYIVGTPRAVLLVPASQKWQTLAIAFAIAASFSRISGGGGSA